MKKYAVIPIFIPHQGCPHDCIFCNQKKITAHEAPPTADEIRETLEIWLSTLKDVPTVELAFYGGSFTAIPIEEQNLYLEAAEPFLSPEIYPPSGSHRSNTLRTPAAQTRSTRKISAIRLSTRPDCITPEILENLKAHGVKTIELGVQSLDPEVLRLSGRGHDVDCIYESAHMIKAYGFRLGIQLMIGLPGDTLEKCIFSARETVKLAPSIARLYPTVVMPDTELYEQYLRGSYIPLTEDEAVLRTKEMYRILTAADIQIIRVGLKSSHVIVGDGGAVDGTYHPAFRQLVEGSLARDALQAQLADLGFLPVTAGASDSAGDFTGGPTSGSTTDSAGGSASDSAGSSTNDSTTDSAGVASAAADSCHTDAAPADSVADSVAGGSDATTKVDFYSNPRCFSNLIGNSGRNRSFFCEHYPQLNIRFKTDPSLPNETYLVKLHSQSERGLQNRPK